ncbi:hypothetical protein QOT17_003054 [Balamuthia mandrillaris]
MRMWHQRLSGKEWLLLSGQRVRLGLVDGSQREGTFYTKDPQWHHVVLLVENEEAEQPGGGGGDEAEEGELERSYRSCVVFSHAITRFELLINKKEIEND